MPKYDLSILIPARNEMFLARTVQDILEHKQGKTEILVGLDGQWAEPGIPDHPDVKIVYVAQSIGQRAITNKLCQLSEAKYIIKCDAHCAFDDGFDVKMMAEMHDDWTMAPIMRNLHAFDWVCPNGHRRYQSPSGPCRECGAATERDVVWIPKTSPQSTAYCFDTEPHFQYMGDMKKRGTYKHDLEEYGITETMSLQGSFFMLTREKYWELDICSEEFGSWGSQGIEVAVKTWLSGGRVVVNHKTWYSHMFRTQGLDFGFPYPISGRQVNHAKKYAKELFFENKWPLQVKPLSWLLERFWPVWGWTEEDLRRLQAIPFTAPSPMADHTASMAINGSGEGMPSVAVSLSSFTGSSSVPSKDILGVGNESEVNGVTASTIVADVVENGDVSSFTKRDRPDEQHVSKAVGSIENLINADISVPIVQSSSPVPATGNGVNTNLSKKSDYRSGGDFHTPNVPQKGLLYYTDNQLKVSIAKQVQRQLQKVKLPITSVSLKPMPHFGTNIHIPEQRGMMTYFKQILAGLEASDADIIFFTEHDVFYHPSHFDFTPPDKHKFYYNHNFWRVRDDGFAVHWDANQVSGLACYRQHALEYYRNRLEEITANGFNRSYEPGGRDPKQFEVWWSKYPNIDIRHGQTLTKSKWSPDDFRDKSTCVNWQESTIDKIPGWENLRIL